jgi:hypothetical protein
VHNRKSVNWVASIVIAVTTLWLYLFLYPSPPAIDTRPHQGLGAALAGEAMKLGDASTRLIVIVRDQVSFQLPATKTQLDSFHRTLKAAGRSAATVRTIKEDPLRVAGVQPGEFFELLRQAKENDVFISFLGPPVLADDQLRKLGPKRPRIVALCTGAMPARVDLKKAFEQQLLHTAIVSRAEAPAKAVAGNAQAAFEQLFKVITSGNLAELSALNVTAKSD